MQDPFNGGAPSGAAVLPSLNDRSPERNAVAATPVNQGQAAADDAGRPASLARQAKQKFAGTLYSQKDAAADFVAQLAETVQRSGERFEGQQGWIASAVGRGADELNTLAGSIRDKNLDELASEVGAFARRRPALFIGAALAMGFAAGRLGKVVAGDLSRDDLPTVPEVGNAQH